MEGRGREETGKEKKRNGALGRKIMLWSEKLPIKNLLCDVALRQNSLTTCCSSYSLLLQNFLSYLYIYIKWLPTQHQSAAQYCP